MEFQIGELSEDDQKYNRNTHTHTHIHIQNKKLSAAEAIKIAHISHKYVRAIKSLIIFC